MGHEGETFSAHRKRKSSKVVKPWNFSWSEWEDSNFRPLEPHWLPDGSRDDSDQYKIPSFCVGFSARLMLIYYYTQFFHKSKQNIKYLQILRTYNEQNTNWARTAFTALVIAVFFCSYSHHYTNCYRHASNFIARRKQESSNSESTSINFQTTPAQGRFIQYGVLLSFMYCWDQNAALFLRERAIKMTRPKSILAIMNSQRQRCKTSQKQG